MIQSSQILCTLIHKQIRKCFFEIGVHLGSLLKLVSLQKEALDICHIFAFLCSILDTLQKLDYKKWDYIQI